MQESRTKNTTRNMFWGFASSGVQILLAFLIRTMIIRVLGSDYLGLGSLFCSILQVLNMAELGFSSAVVFSMYRPLALNDTDTVCALLNLYRKIYRLIGCVILSCGLVIMPFLPKLIKSSWPVDINLYRLYLIYLANTAVSYFVFAYRSSLLEANQRKDVTSRIYTACRIIEYLLQILLLLLFRNYYIYIITLPVFTVINSALIAVASKRLFPQYVCRGSLDRTITAGIRKNVGGLMIQRICSATRTSFDSIFISAFLGLTSVTIYGNYYYIMNAVLSVLTIMTSAMLASVGNSVATESQGKNHEDMMRFVYIYAWVSGWCVTCLAVLYQPFMRLWVGESLMLPYGTVVVFCVYFYLLTMGEIASVYSNATGLFWHKRFRALLEASANVLMNYLFVRWWGIFGIVLATVISVFMFSFLYGTSITYKRYFTRMKITRYYMNQGFYALVAFMVSTLTVLLCSFLPDGGVVLFIVKVLICMTFPGLVYLLVYSNSRHFEYVRQLGGSVVNIVKKSWFSGR